MSGVAKGGTQVNFAMETTPGTWAVLLSSPSIV